MARFYGTVQGARGRVTRLGHQHLNVTAQSYAGDVCVNMEHGGKDGAELVDIYVRPHNGGSGFCLYSGKVSELLSQDARFAKLQALGLDAFIKAHEEGKL